MHIEPFELKKIARPARAALRLVLLVIWLAGCALPGNVTEPSGMGPTEAREAIQGLLPPGTADRAGWADRR